MGNVGFGRVVVGLLSHCSRWVSKGALLSDVVVTVMTMMYEAASEGTGWVGLRAVGGYR